MSETEIKAVIERWVQAFNERDAEMAAALYAEDADNLQLAVGEPLIGREAILKDLKSFFAAIPDNYTHHRRFYVDPPWVILEWSGGGTFHASEDSPGKPIRLDGCGFFEIRDGKIQTQRGYWDMKTWIDQIS